MAGRRTNLALLALLAIALATGALAFAIGVSWVRWVAAAHAVAAFAMLLLAPWKSTVVRRGLRRRRFGVRASVIFTVLVAVATATGLLHSAGAVRSFGAFSAMQVHVASALGAIPFGVWHVVARRVHPRRTDLSRRTVLRAGVLLGGAAAVYSTTEGLVRVAGLPAGGRRFTGSYERGSGRPGDMPVTQWLDDAVPAVDPAEWRLAVRANGAERRVTYDELAGFRDVEPATLDCTGGWFAEQEWTGIRLDRLLPAIEGARSIAITSVTGYSRRFPARDASRLLLATRVAGAPLSAGHGFPARLVAPGRRGFWWVKWVAAVELSEAPWWWQPPFPLS